MANPTRHLWLLGLSGSGKSTLGSRLARALGLPWIDTDAEIVRKAGKSIPEIFQSEGEEGFRERESQVLKGIAAGPASVVSCGGGIVLRRANRTCLATTGTRVYLKSDPATLARRLHASVDRPLLAGDSRETVLLQQLTERAPFYEESEIKVDVSRLNPDQTVAAIRDQLPVPWSR